jgi:type VI secretion system protein ImpF
LLDRLLDDQPSNQSDESGLSTFNAQRLHACVLRDLDMLLNHRTLSEVEDLGDLPRVRSSVLNYGFPSMLGAATNAAAIEEARKRLQQVLIDFEPRIEGKSLRVEALEPDDETVGTIVFRVTGRLLTQPLPTGLDLRTVVDLSTGDAVVTEEHGGNEGGRS